MSEMSNGRRNQFPDDFLSLFVDKFKDKTMNTYLRTDLSRFPGFFNNGLIRNERLNAQVVFPYI